MMLERATGFERLHSKEAEKAKMVGEDYIAGRKSIEEVREAATALATTALRDDLIYQLKNGKGIKFTPRVKNLFMQQLDDLEKHNVVVTEHGRYTCLICGENVKSGDIVLTETDGSSNAICFDCLCNKNTYKDGGNMRFIKLQ